MERALKGWLAGLVCVLAAPTMAAEFSNPAFTQERGATSVPVGYVQFCRDNASSCAETPQAEARAVMLTQPLWDQLTTINDEVNAAVAPETDQDRYGVEEYWTYPNGAGDCEDYVLEKRKELLAAGWPEGDLLITVVRKLDGQGHAVLVVRTDRGDVVLDNLTGLVQVWDETPYVYIKRQSQTDNRTWVALQDDRQIISAALQ